MRSAASTPDPTSANPSWGRYRQRGSVGGIPICAFDCVSQEALDIAAATLECMLAHVEPAVVVRMARLGAEVAIIGRGQSTTDIPAHAHLKGQSCGDGRDFDAGTRGLGGTVACPITSVGEENVTMKGDFRYPSESILVHEFAHAVMNIGLFGTSQHDAIKAAYENAVKLRLYPDCYMSSNADEYWAEGTQVSSRSCWP